MSTATISTSSNVPASSGTPEATPVERRCENADCNASKLLSMVPKRKTQQFVTEPNVMEKPMLINGFTTVFQVDGASAKLSDLKNVPNTGATQPKTIYRIVPNTHAHIVNYVVVDAEGESLRKINESEPATMRKLLESQKVSADQMLKKLIAGVALAGGTNVNTNNNNGVTVSVNSRTSTATQSLVPNTTAQITQKLPTQTTAKLTTVASSSAPTISTAQIQLPLRMHPNLKITAVASADTVSAMTAPTTVPVAPPSVPLITPVPLSALQSPPVLGSQRSNLSIAPVVPATPSSSTATQQMPVIDTVDKPVFDKMQAELQELRRTVALLAEAQAKNQMGQGNAPIIAKPNTTVATSLRVTKRLRQS